LAGLRKLESLIGHGGSVRERIAEAVGLVIFIDGDDRVPAGRKVREVIVVQGFDPVRQDYQLTYVWEERWIKVQKKNLQGLVRFGVRAALAGIALVVSSAPMWAAGGTLAATQAINAAGTELSGPFAYGASLSMIVAGAIYWYRHHHDMGALGGGLIGTLLVGGVAMGAPTVLHMIPGATGVLI
jgi:hypothetical protein